MSTTSNLGMLRNAPPPKNPYFQLPDAKFLILLTPPATLPPATKSSSASTRVKAQVKALTFSQIFGVVAKMSDEGQAEFLMRLISNSKFEPDFQKLAKELGVKGKKGVQDRFQGLAKKHGFEVDKDSQIKSKPFNPKKDIQPVISNTKPVKEKSVIANKTTEITLKTTGESKEKTKRPVKEGAAKVKKRKTKPGSKGPVSNAPKAVKKKKVTDNVIEAEQSMTEANVNIMWQPEVPESVDKSPVTQRSTAATIEEVEDVEMGRVRQAVDTLEVSAGDI